MIPAGVAAVQARISAIESRFVSTRVPDPGQSIDFERMLARARSDIPTSSSGLVGTGDKTIGAAGAPPELASYGNGNIPATALTPIGQGSHRMWAPAAASFQDMADAAARDGVAIRVTDSYRSYDQQVDLAARKGLYSDGGLAAVPGTSNHGWGRALDIDVDNGTLEWLRANGADYGFFEDVRGEPWHWTYRPG